MLFGFLIIFILFVFLVEVLNSLFIFVNLVDCKGMLFFKYRNEFVFVLFVNMGDFIVVRCFWLLLW